MRKLPAARAPSKPLEGRYNSDMADDPLQRQKEFWQEYTRNVRLMHFLGEKAEKSRTQHEQRQYDEARGYVRDGFESAIHIMSANLFGEIQLDFDEDAPGQFGWLANLMRDESLRCPVFPAVFTPAVVQELIVKIYGAQTTVASTLEEIEPAYRKWLEFEARIKHIHKAACGLDKEWQTEALFQMGYTEDIFRMVRRLGEYVHALKIRLDQLVRGYEALSRIITVMEMNPTEMMTRKSSETRQYKSQSLGGRGGYTPRT